MYLKKNEIKELCKELLEDFERTLSFKWDSGFSALLAEFSTDRRDEVLAVLERHLGFRFDSSTIRKAPAQIKNKAGDLADLRDNQLLFTTDPEGELLIFAAWWPWGNGELISVRIASPSDAEQAPEQGGVLGKLKRFFG